MSFELFKFKEIKFVYINLVESRLLHESKCTTWKSESDSALCFKNPGLREQRRRIYRVSNPSNPKKNGLKNCDVFTEKSFD